MKLLMVTIVEEFHDDILRLFKKANINNFSESGIGGHKLPSSVLVSTNWFASGKKGTASSLFFSFTNEEKIDVLFELLTTYNNKLETNNPVKAVVVPIEKHL